MPNLRITFHRRKSSTWLDKIVAMTSLNTTLIRDFTRYYQNARENIHALVAPLSDERICARPYPQSNSIGHLLLQRTVIFVDYIGVEIVQTGYVRNRPLE